jgi:hypothetical protein
MSGIIGGQEYGSRGLDSMFADGSQNILGDSKGMGNFGAMQEKKHWPLNIKVRVPNQEEPIQFQFSTNTKIKTLKQMILEHVGPGLL